MYSRASTRKMNKDSTGSFSVKGNLTLELDQDGVFVPPKPKRIKSLIDWEQAIPMDFAIWIVSLSGAQCHLRLSESHVEMKLNPKQWNIGREHKPEWIVGPTDSQRRAVERDVWVQSLEIKRICRLPECIGKGFSLEGFRVMRFLCY